MALSIGVLVGGPLVRFDRSTADTLHAYASETPALTDFFHLISLLGSLEALALVSLLVAIVLLVRRYWSALAAWLAPCARWRSVEPAPQRSLRPALFRALTTSATWQAGLPRGRMVERRHHGLGGDAQTLCGKPQWQGKLTLN